MGAKTIELAAMRATLKRVVEIEAKLAGCDFRSAYDRFKKLRPDIFIELTKLEKAEAKGDD